MGTGVSVGSGVSVGAGVSVDTGTGSVVAAGFGGMVMTGTWVALLVTAAMTTCCCSRGVVAGTGTCSMVISVMELSIFDCTVTASPLPQATSSNTLIKIRSNDLIFNKESHLSACS